MVFDETEIRMAERRMVAALESDDRFAWVAEYTDDAVFDAGEPVRGREALLEMAAHMTPLRDVSITPLHTEGSGDRAAVWCEATWTSGPEDARREVQMRGILVWRREPDGVWRVAIEHLA
ncbi:YybH family protein [Nocardioides taihuensis]|uniref:YybH family protein n=1 Tax=Nocardioides taihuensis TaxID=1835606 RepID=A0ABW0BE98_9ACTN